MEQDTQEKEIFPGYTTIKEFTQDGFKVLVEATRNANTLPQERNWDFYNTHESFRNLMNDEGLNILHLINTIIREQGVLGSFSSRDLDEKIEVIVETNDTILERAAINLDEVNGIRKNPELPVQIQEVSAVLPISGSWNKIDNINCTVSSFVPQNQNLKTTPNAIRLLTAHNIQRPQKFFKDRIDNSNNYPWEPRIKDKPNSLKPLAIFLEENEDGTESYSHPYEYELDRFIPPQCLLTSVIPVAPKLIAETKLCMVETFDQLSEMLEDLRKYKELSVDLEHHSYRTFLGFTCLMQISTQDTDYLIDTLALRDKLCILNEVFTKPSIVKIFHGANHDIEWLQRDLSLYIVNMFDTFQAAKQLNYEQRSLAYLLKKFCHIDANKHFQLADWRIRPLPEELKLYAREDTHYLIYIYHKMRNELIELGNKSPHILKSVIDMSTEICKKRYYKPILSESSHLDLYRKCKKLFDNKQMFALKHLYKWRDTIARDEDESTGYVLPNNMLLQIAENLPREMQGVLACCNPIPPLVRANLLEIHKIILRAREQSLVKPILLEEPRSLGSIKTVTRLNVDNALHCPHDVSNTPEFRDDLPTLLGDVLKQKKNNADAPPEKIDPKPIAVVKPLVVENTKPILNVFETIEGSLKKLQDDVCSKVKKLKFLGPFERYKLIKPYVQSEEGKIEFLAKEKKVPERKALGHVDELINIEASNDGRNKKMSKRTVTGNVGGSLSIQIQNVSRGREHRNPPKYIETRDVVPLRQMKGVKRKRSPSNHPQEAEQNEVDNSVEARVADLGDVRPNPENNNNNKGRKRRNRYRNKNAKRTRLSTREQTNISRQNAPNIVRDFANKKERRLYMQALRLEQQSLQENHPQSKNNQQVQQNLHQPKKHPQNINRNTRNQEQSNSQQNQNNRQQNQSNQQRNKKNNKNKNGGTNHSNFQPFDYSTVDFRQFQGGGSSVNTAALLNSKFKGKNKSKIKGKNLGKGNNKSSFFGMGSNSGKDRGR